MQTKRHREDSYRRIRIHDRYKAMRCGRRGLSICRRLAGENHLPWSGIVPHLFTEDLKYVYNKITHRACCTVSTHTALYLRLAGNGNSSVWATDEKFYDLHGNCRRWKTQTFWLKLCLILYVVEDLCFQILDF